LLGFLSRVAPNKVFCSILLAVLAGFAYALFVPLVMRSVELAGGTELPALHDERFELLGMEISNPGYAAAFLSLCALILIARTASNVLLQWVAIDAACSLRMQIYERVAQLPIIELERIGPSRLQSAISNDVPAVIAGASAMPGILSSVTSMVGVLGFLAYLDVRLFFMVVGAIAFGLLSFRLPLAFGNRFYMRSRSRLDGIQEGIRGLLYGAKELKLNRTKRQAFMAHELEAREASYREDSRKATLLLSLALNYGSMIAFVVIGLVAFVMSSAYDISAQTLTAIVMALLYLTGVLGPMLHSVTPVVQGSTALKTLNVLLQQMPIEIAGASSTAAQVKTIELRNVALTYPLRGEVNRTFELGPIDLTLRSGEVTFIVGGNGSGKSTLGKVLSLHYLPTQGAVHFDGHPVTNANRDEWRQSVAAIYSDFYLFPKLYGVAQRDLESLALRYLSELGLELKVAIRDGGFSTTALSDGQRRRLALLVMYLENRDVYVFDEWAADQDPHFKDVFYLRILKELRERGKLIIVISHDDRYYHVADRIVRMEDGQVMQDSASATGVSERREGCR